MHAATSILVGYNQTPEAQVASRCALEAARVRHVPIRVVAAGRLAAPRGHHPGAPSLEELAEQSIETPNG